MRTVKNTVRTGRTVVCTIHQPSIDIFEVQLAETPASCISWFTKVINRLFSRVTPNHCCCCSRLSWPSLIALRPDLCCRASLRVSWQVMVLEVMHGQNKGKHVISSMAVYLQSSHAMSITQRTRHLWLKSSSKICPQYGQHRSNNESARVCSTTMIFLKALSVLSIAGLLLHPSGLSVAVLGWPICDCCRLSMS